MGRRINWPWSEGDVGLGADGYTPALLLPALTDVRSAVQGVENDVIEVPAGSGRWYNVAGVDDVGKGFDNEYRIVSLRQISHFRDWIPLGIPYWPIPMP
jgi:hypothetical protein